jgi:O-antigen ligase
MLKFSIPFLYLIIGYNIIIDELTYKYFVNKSWIFITYFCVYILICNAFSIGEEFYKGGLKIGYYSLNGVYISCFSILFLLFNYKMIEKKTIKIIVFISIILASIIYLLLLKRTLIVILALGGILFLIQKINLLKVLKYTIILFFAILFISTFFMDSITEKLSSRESRFNKNYSVKNEGRFRENFMIFDMIKDSYFKMIFGTGEVFNDRVYFMNKYKINREAHNSFIRLYWNGGLIGLLLFVSFYFRQLAENFKYFKLSRRIKHKTIQNILFFGLVFISLRFINDFSSGITYISYNSFSYLIIGGILRIGKNLELDHRLKLRNKDTYSLA